jgi:hypothetical protein
MIAPENLSAQMADKTNEELLAMFKRPEDWLPEAQDDARAELQRRGVDTSTIHIGPPPIPNGQPVFFGVSPLKLVLMSTVTFGIYELYWFYKNWKLIKQRTESNIMPFWRAFFLVFFCYSCFREVKDVAASRGVSFPSSPGMLAAGWIILTILWQLPDPYWFVCFLAPLMLVPVQNAINRLNAVIAPDHSPNSRFSAWNIVGLVVGGILFVFTIIGTFLPQ